MVFAAKSDLRDGPSLGSHPQSLGAHALKSPFLGRDFFGRNRCFQPLASSLTSEDRGALRAFKNRFTAGESTRLVRETTPSGRMISGP